jgi:hypothetical protein
VRSAAGGQRGIDADAVHELVATAHGQMLRRLARAKQLDDLALAHLAHGLALGRLLPIEARGAAFPCFAPKPLDAHGLVALLGGPREGDRPAVIADGSELARVAIALTGEWARVAADTLPQLAPSPPQLLPAAPQHPLEPLVERLCARLSAIGVPWSSWRIDDRDSPLVRFEHGALRLAGNARRLHDLPADALDALAAHAVTVLNIALTEITDASEAHAIAELLTSPARACRSP